MIDRGDSSCGEHRKGVNMERIGSKDAVPQREFVIAHVPSIEDGSEKKVYSELLERIIVRAVALRGQ